MTQEPNEQILKKIDASRREFVKRVLGAAAFAAPVVATFSIDGLGVDSALAQTNSSGPSHCAIDTGYIGPSKFHAHISDPTRATRVQAQVEFDIEAEGPDGPRRLETHLEVSNDATVLAAYVKVGNFVVASLSDKKGVIGIGDVHNLCDFDALLQALAAKQVTVVIEGMFAGEPYSVSGILEPHGGKIRLPAL